MKNYIVFGIALIEIFLTGLLSAEEPTEIPRLVERQMSVEWYSEQVKLWEQEIKRDLKNEKAWFNYFKASRYEGMGAEQKPEDWTKRAEKQKLLLEKMQKAIPESFTYNYCMWWNGGNKLDLFPYLEKAYSFRKDYIEISSDFATYYEITLNKTKRDYFLNEWYKSKAMSPDLLMFAYNILMSLEKNAILFTSGDNDTYPLWILQSVKGIREDVTVINISLFNIENYRKETMKNKNIKGNPNIMNDENINKNGYIETCSEFIKNLGDNNPDKPVYVCLTVPPDYLKPIQDKFYMVGLVNKYSNNRIDNIALLKNNWEKFNLAYLDFLPYNENYLFNIETKLSVDLIYIPSAMLLYEHYKLSGENDKAEKLKAFMYKVAKAGNEIKSLEENLEKIK